MKGDIFNLLESFIVDKWGIETFEEVYESVRGKLITKEPFVGPGTYPDEDFFSLMTSTCERMKIPLSRAAYAFGVFACPLLLRKVPGLIEQYKHPKDLLLSIHDVIHVEVRKICSGATPPDFSYEDPEPHRLVMIYKSKRRLFDFVEGMIRGVSQHYDVPIQVLRTYDDINPDTCRYTMTFGK